MAIDTDFQYSGPAINEALAARCAERYWSGLEKGITNAAAATARSATQLENQLNAFDGVLDAEQLLALSAAKSVASKLAADLKRLKPWAKSYVAFRDAKAARRREQDLLDEGAKLWPSDDTAVAEAEALVTFHASGEPGADVEAFILARRPGYTAVHRDTSRGDANRALADLPAAIEARDMVQVRRNSALVLREMSRGFGGSRGNWFAGRADYLAWREAHHQACQATSLHSPRSSRPDPLTS